LNIFGLKTSFKRARMPHYDSIVVHWQS